MRGVRWPLACVVAAALAASFAEAGHRRAIPGGVDPAEYLADVRYLASDELRGRGTGTPELDKAARYIAGEFQRLGLLPAANGSYFEKFAVTVAPHEGRRNRFAHAEGATRITLERDSEFVPLSFTASGAANAHVAFAGYGITAPEYGYDDYAGLDVKGKVVVILRHEPQEYDRRSVFEGRVYTEHAQMGSKADNARAHGAVAVIVVNDTANHSGSDALEKFTPFTTAASPGIPVVQVRAEVVERWFRSNERDFREAQDSIDRRLVPQSFAFPAALTVSIETDVASEQRMVANVAAMLPGSTPEYVVVGAHYDHLGLGEQFSLANAPPGTPHPGADDNASGAAGVIAVARWFRAQPRPRRGILFLAFAGEEIGLLGSSYYVHHPLLPPSGAAAMINLDMIGRLRDRTLIVGGSRSGAGFATLLADAQKRSDLVLDTSDDAVYGSSDHTSFLTLQVPVLFFFTGLHSDYHRPSDTWEKIDSAATARVLDLVAEVTVNLANAPQRPKFQRAAPQAEPASADKM